MSSRVAAPPTTGTGAPCETPPTLKLTMPAASDGVTVAVSVYLPPMRTCWAGLTARVVVVSTAGATGSFTRQVSPVTSM